ncbi:MAG: excinuclease ABC subunit UvrA [Candidatus Pacebacteria bacterium]|nr:excinuclease ABC subunit UvrA [Candidatus Paceibacterota bacterium]
MEDKITIKGARTHNLKNINVEMPRNKMVVISGLSGSGKSSLAFDTIFAEGQRRYVESLSAYARQFLRQMQKPDVDEISGLSPAISIDQKSRSNNPRSTVATITEIYDYLRVLYARVGRPHCLKCDRPIHKLSNEQILDTIKKLIAASTKKSKKDSKIMGVDVGTAKIQLYAPVVVGRKGEYYQLLYDMLGKGYEKARIDGKEISLREKVTLTKTKKHDIDILVDEIYISEFKEDKKGSEERISEAIERALSETDGLMRVVDPAGEEHVISSKFMCPYDGFSFPEVEPRLFSFNSPYGACEECKGLGTKHFFADDPCEVCNGARLRPEALRVFLGEGKNRRNIVELVNLSISEAQDFFIELELTDTEKEIAKVIKKEITDRLQFMLNVGISYLALDRRANTLSGGEAQRIRLASQLGSGLVGAMYVLDEPTIGLHQRDNARLIKTLTNLRDLGNTIIVVEHDEETIFSADYLIDIGPGAGVHGGEVVAAGWLKDLLAAKTNKSKSSTLAYLRGEKEIKVPEKRRETNKGALMIRGGKRFSIKNLSVDVPLGRLVTITGVSGSGKSTFMYEILHENLRARLDRKYRTNKVYNCARFSGTEYISRSILIDQSPIGRTPRSNPATYTGAFTHIRDLFSETIEARSRGWKPGRFSFNVKGGRCEACQGNGMVAVEMHFLPTVHVLCDVCRGNRFMKETLEIEYKGKTIHQVLQMTIEEALAFFEDIPGVYDRFKALSDVGLGYLKLGQSATTLSGGEAQRVKIASELYRPGMTKTMYLLDEPTVGLHYDDVEKLIEILQELVRRGNSVVLIEHNMDIIKSSDYVLDFGPEGGDEGGTLVAKGTPEEVAKVKGSHTAKYLDKVLRKRAPKK